MTLNILIEFFIYYVKRLNLVAYITSHKASFRENVQHEWKKLNYVQSHMNLAEDSQKVFNQIISTL